MDCLGFLEFKKTPMGKCDMNAPEEIFLLRIKEKSRVNYRKMKENESDPKTTTTTK